ncbi:S41 family peptidase [Chryseobacterium joostei]|uniref:S41 family peptidase n=1 Tax=Chryseobacterium joostei TaxID=112234 RepID=UPI003D11EF5A
MENFKYDPYRKKICQVLATILLVILWACKKEPKVDENNSPKTGSRTELTIDSLFLYAKEVYLWNDILPSYGTFSPREKYTHIVPEIKALNTELFDISQLKVNEKTQLPFEYNSGFPRYSYLQRKSDQTSKADAIALSNLKKNDIIFSSVDKISYFAIHSFPPLNVIKSDLDRIFINIAELRPKYLVVDLRYNKGGYIETAEYIANLIAPSRLNGKMMYSEKYNNTLASGEAKILKNQPYLDNAGNYVKIGGRQATLADADFSEKGNTYNFKKKGKLEGIENIYFITSGSTASASELLISVFKPYLNVKLVGKKTYGKPVGYFAINIDKYSIYMSSFLLKNADGWFDYFEGIEPNIVVNLLDNPKFGHPDEAGFKSVIQEINGSEPKLLAKKSMRVFKYRIYKINIKHQYQETLSVEDRLKIRRNLDY